MTGLPRKPLVVIVRNDDIDEDLVHYAEMQPPIPREKSLAPWVAAFIVAFLLALAVDFFAK